AGLANLQIARRLQPLEQARTSDLVVHCPRSCIRRWPAGASPDVVDGSVEELAALRLPLARLRRGRLQELVDLHELVEGVARLDADVYLDAFSGGTVGDVPGAVLGREALLHQIEQDRFVVRAPAEGDVERTCVLASRPVEPEPGILVADAVEAVETPARAK